MGAKLPKAFARMSALPIFDEARREFVPATSAPQPPQGAPVAERAAAPAPRPSIRLQPAERDDRLSVFESCLTRIRQQLDERGQTADAETVGDLIGFLNSPQAAKAMADERDHRPIYAVGAAYIDVLALTSDEAAAAQTLARKLVALGYELPKQGGDTRGWKRLLLWRDQLVRGHMPAELHDIYERALKFARKAPAALDVKAALDHALEPDPR
jgi:hypothetical protein